MSVERLREHRQHMQMLLDCEPGDRFAYAVYQAWCIGADERVERWDALTGEVRSGWRAAADFCEMYTGVLEIEKIVRAL